jgi:hypothetical protein
MAIARACHFPQCLISPAYNEKLVWGCAIFCFLRTATRHFIHVSRRLRLNPGKEFSLRAIVEATNLILNSVTCPMNFSGWLFIGDGK